jgi:hypothetical protein
MSNVTDALAAHRTTVSTDGTTFTARCVCGWSRQSGYANLAAIDASAHRWQIRVEAERRAARA